MAVLVLAEHGEDELSRQALAFAGTLGEPEAFLVGGAGVRVSTGFWRARSLAGTDG